MQHNKRKAISRRLWGLLFKSGDNWKLRDGMREFEVLMVDLLLVFLLLDAVAKVLHQTYSSWIW